MLFFFTGISLFYIFLLSFFYRSKKEKLKKKMTKQIPDESYEETLEKKHQERLLQFETRRNERIAQYEAKRQARLKQRQESNETSEAFLESFNKGKRDIVNQLNQVTEKTPVFERAALFDSILQKISNLWKFISDSLSFLPNYDVRRAQEIVKEIRLQVLEKREILMPKKKFAFKCRQRLTPSVKSQSTSYNGDDSSNTTVKKEVSVPQQTSNNLVGFCDHFDETLTLGDAECSGKDINISNINNCTLYMKGSPSAVRFNKVMNSRIYCGPVSRSVFVNDCIDSELHLACQQLRIHTTINSKFYIHVTSKAIIEDCEELGFADYDFVYENRDRHFSVSGLSRDTNNWKDVDDFNWLKLDEPSPNWYLLQSVSADEK